MIYQKSAGKFKPLGSFTTDASSGSNTMFPVDHRFIYGSYRILLSKPTRSYLYTTCNRKNTIIL